MTRQDHLAAAERLFAEGHARANAELLQAAFSPQFVDHGLPKDFAPSLDGTQAFLLALRTGIPDLRCTIEESFLARGQAVLRVAGQRTMRGPLFGHPPGGRAA